MTNICDLPLDISLMIMNNLHVLDLNNLIQVNKHFNKMIKTNRKNIKPEIQIYDIHDSYDIDSVLKKYNNNIKLKLGSKHDLCKYQIYIYEINLMYIPRYHNISDLLFGINKIHTLNISHNYFTNVNLLGNISIKILDLSYCRFLSSVPFIKGLKEINLTGCTGLTDLSSIAHVESINLSYCDNLTDISVLNRVSDLNISCCLNITTDITQFFNLKKLNIAYCHKLVCNIPFLQQINTLFINCKFEYRNFFPRAKLIHGHNMSDRKTWCFNCNSRVEKYYG